MTTHTVGLTPSLLMVAAPASLGHVAVAVDGDAIFGASFGHRSNAQAIDRLVRLLGGPLATAPTGARRDSRERFALKALDRLVRFLDGEPVSFDDLPVSLDHLSPFQRRVAAACRAIPYGVTRTYGQLAAIAGSAGAARAVGQVMATNRVPLIVPCHRVVAASGKLGGFSAPLGVAMKRRLLAMESGDDRAAMPRSASRASQRELALTLS